MRFCHPRKILAATRLPAADALDVDALAALAGTSAARYEELAAAMRREARAAGAELAGHAAVSREPLAHVGSVLAVGDSITDDLGSWARMLAAALPHARVVDAGLSGDTTTNVVARSARLPGADLAIVLLGTNDARRHGRNRFPMLVSDRETARNLRLLDRLLRGQCRRVVWVTPPPVLDERIEADDGFRESGVLWQRADLRRKAAIVRAAFADVVDLWAAFGDPPDPALLRSDGLHPSAAGQRAIARAILDAL